MRASTRVEYRKLVRHVEKSLTSLGYPFLRNETKRLTEFEVLPPSGFRVVVEDNSREDYSFGFIRSKKTETSLELRRELGTPESDGFVDKHVSAFMEHLTSALPEKPWEGLGLVRSRTERAKWLELSDI
ncbi:MAG: hypothetical protein ACLQEQ_00075 [Nitrososphaerales archaeon]